MARRAISKNGAPTEPNDGTINTVIKGKTTKKQSLAPVLNIYTDNRTSAEFLGRTVDGGIIQFFRRMKELKHSEIKDALGISTSKLYALERGATTFTQELSDSFYEFLISKGISKMHIDIGLDFYLEVKEIDLDTERKKIIANRTKRAN